MVFKVQEKNQDHESRISLDGEFDKLNTPSNKDLLNVITQINERTRAIESTLKSHDSAFVINDLGTPDYDGHRKSHIKLENEANIVENYKKNVSEVIIKWGVGALLLILVTGLGETVRQWLAN
jgi:hypothetical protein